MDLAHPFPDASARRRIFGLDLVRALAIALVLVSHCGAVFAGWYGGTIPLALANCGTFGVEIFFVLSGYLVGRILLRTAPTPAGWRGFMLRRWRRTVPLYYLALGALFCIWPPVFWAPGHWAILWRAVPTYALFLQNFAWPVGLNNWFGASWSLAVEEWFYLLFSVLVLSLTAATSRRTALLVACACFLIVPALARGLSRPVSAAPHSVVSAVDQICIGVLMAWFSLARPARFAALARLLPVGLALCALFWWEQRWIAAPLRQALWPDVLGAGIALSLPAACARPDGHGTAAAVVRAISLRSYGLYIVHLPVLELASFYRHLLPAPKWCPVAGALAVIALLPALTWRYIERPMLAQP